MITDTWRVERLETSDKEYQALKRAGLNTFGDMAALSRDELAAKAKISPTAAEKLLKQIADITREEEEYNVVEPDELPPSSLPCESSAATSGDTLDKLFDMQEYIEGIQGFAMVLKENLYNSYSSGGMDGAQARAAAYVAEEIYKNLGGVLETTVEIEHELMKGESLTA